jgi:lipopolysaccharide transport system ATP-binding protein
VNAESFGAGGAKIIDAGFCDEDGKRIDKIEGGKFVQFFISVRANQVIYYPAAGIMIKDRLGQYLYTAGTDKSFRDHSLVLQEFEELRATFKFSMPILVRGVYTINVAFAEGIGDDHIQHHWIHDAIMMEALSGPVVHGLGSPLNMKITMEFLSTGQGVVV